MTNQPTPEEAFARAAAEFDGDDARPGLLAMAEAQADGDPQRTRAAYLRLRSAQLLGVPPAGSAPPSAPPPRSAPPPPPPPPERKSPAVAIGVATLVFLSLAALAFLFVRSGGEAESDVADEPLVEEAEPVPEPVVVSVDCASTRSRVGGRSPSEILGSAVGSLIDKSSMEAVVTVRNAGVAGEVVVAVAAFSEVQPGALGREQTVSLAAGERRQLTFTFDPTPFSRGGACRAWTAPLGDPLADFDAFVETYNAVPEAAPRPAPAPEPEPVLDPEPPAEPAPPPAAEPLPRRPQPDPPSEPSPDAPPADGGGDAAPDPDQG